MGIRRCRKMRNMTQEELAKAVGVTQGYICTLENGKRSNPSLQLLIRIADALGVPLNDLIDIDRYIKEQAIER